MNTVKMLISNNVNAQVLVILHIYRWTPHQLCRVPPSSLTLPCTLL